MKKYPNTDVSNSFYNFYLANLKKWCPPEITDKLVDINRKHGVKIFTIKLGVLGLPFWKMAVLIPIQ